MILYRVFELASFSSQPPVRAVGKLSSKMRLQVTKVKGRTSRLLAGSPEVSVADS